MELLLAILLFLFEVFVFWFVIPLSLLWLCFLAAMNLKRDYKEGTLTQPAYCVALVLVGFAYLLDVWVNFTIGTIVFLEFPREFTVTQRLNRVYKKSAWGYFVASYVAKHYLDRYDPKGYHCDVFRSPLPPPK